MSCSVIIKKQGEESIINKNHETLHTTIFYIYVLCSRTDKQTDKKLE